MGTSELINRSRVRARPAGLISPITRRPIFRIEDESGRILRRISSARTAGEALAHYWRGAGGDAKLLPAMPEPPSDAGLRRRIDQARSARGRGLANRDAMQTHELPLPELDLDDATPEPDEPQAAAVPPAPAARRREPRPRPAIPDLFAAAEPEPVIETTVSETAPEPVPEPAPELVPESKPELVPEPRPEPAIVPEPPPGPRPEPVRQPEPDAQAPYHLDPHAVLLQQVDHRNLRPTDRSDSYLYHVTNRGEATSALRNGLVVSAHDPVILTERQGVAYWLSVLAEDFDVILDGPADFVVLRMRRFAVESLLEPDPDASRSAGCSCYLLTGGSGVSE